MTACKVLASLRPSRVGSLQMSQTVHLRMTSITRPETSPKTLMRAQSPKARAHMSSDGVPFEHPLITVEEESVSMSARKRTASASSPFSGSSVMIIDDCICLHLMTIDERTHSLSKYFLKVVTFHEQKGMRAVGLHRSRGTD